MSKGLDLFSWRQCDMAFPSWRRPKTLLAKPMLMARRASTFRAETRKPSSTDWFLCCGTRRCQRGWAKRAAVAGENTLVIHHFVLASARLSVPGWRRKDTSQDGNFQQANLHSGPFIRSEQQSALVDRKHYVL